MRTWRRSTALPAGCWQGRRDRKSTRLNSSHGYISYAVFCLKKKKKSKRHVRPPHLTVESTFSCVSIRSSRPFIPVSVLHFALCYGDTIPTLLADRSACDSVS